MAFGRSLPRSGVLAFENRFPDAGDKQQIVRLQRLGWHRTLLALVNGELTAPTRRLLAVSDSLHRLAPLFGSLS